MNGALGSDKSVLVLGASLAAHAETDQQASAFVLCKNNKIVRTIRVTGDRDNCTTTYSKGGKDEVVGTNRSLEQCKSVLDRVRENLEGSNFSCRDVSSAVVTTSSEVSRQ